MTIADLTPDVALAALLDKQVTVYTGYESHEIRCYADGLMPNKGLGKEFLTTQWNGGARSLTQPLGVYRGNLALTVYCELQANNTVKTQRVRQILGQCEILANGTSADGFFFRLDATNVIMPTTPNLTTGYSATTINVEWRTTN